MDDTHRLPNHTLSRRSPSSYQTYSSARKYFDDGGSLCDETLADPTGADYATVARNVVRRREMLQLAAVVGIQSS